MVVPPSLLIDTIIHPQTSNFNPKKRNFSLHLANICCLWHKNNKKRPFAHWYLLINQKILATQKGCAIKKD